MAKPKKTTKTNKNTLKQDIDKILTETPNIAVNDIHGKDLINLMSDTFFKEKPIPEAPSDLLPNRDERNQQKSNLVCGTLDEINEVIVGEPSGIANVSKERLESINRHDPKKLPPRRPLDSPKVTTLREAKNALVKLVETYLKSGDYTKVLKFTQIIVEIDVDIIQHSTVKDFSFNHSVRLPTQCCKSS